MEDDREYEVCLDAFIQGSEAFPIPFRLRISPPEYDPEFAYFCWIDCPFIQKRIFKIYGHDDHQARELALRFVTKWLADDGIRLIDKFGQPVQVPKPPSAIDYANDRY